MSNELSTYPLPAKATLNDFDLIFSELHGKVSDFFLQPEYPVMVRYRGRLVSVTNNVISKASMDALMDEMVSAVRKALILKGQPQGWSHRIRLATASKESNDLTESAQVLRFRCNAKSVQTGYSNEEFSLVLRPTEEASRDIESLGLPQPLIEGLFPESGMVLFSGPTGSGKTTTLAACLKSVLYHPDGKVVVTIEDPVEFNHHALPNKTGYLTHCEVGRNVDSFQLAMRAALRENPDVLMTGEMRDEESMLIAIEASQTGHALYSTIHANSVTSVFVRVAQKLNPDKMEATLATFIESSRTFVFQRLFPSELGGMVAIIEYICLTGNDRIALTDALKTGGVAAVTRKMNDLMDASGQWYIDSAKEAFNAGKLSESNYNNIVRTYQLDKATEQ
ncbi:type IV pilus twitching motility protein PilT [Cellvibrio sp. QJXJ]|uniref:type IV pilus twitching motility protein PilT n=1 Tax=Cellvibrio sp. QJXJ TaxID=2964606 RepID=UPI0021C4968C|nr:ATPase, T2SS/T4P/T4SS family [Cellvibrio sp. QJXJ]UUA75137.1 ATPase, T2SS/T4P/T4SS family [Cellvibrio sp. QJXJ]